MIAEIRLEKIHHGIEATKTLVYFPTLANWWDFPLFENTFKNYNVYALYMDFNHSLDIEKITDLIHEAIEKLIFKALYTYLLIVLNIYI